MVFKNNGLDGKLERLRKVKQKLKKAQFEKLLKKVEF